MPGLLPAGPPTLPTCDWCEGDVAPSEANTMFPQKLQTEGERKQKQRRWRSSAQRQAGGHSSSIDTDAHIDTLADSWVKEARACWSHL